MVHQSQIERGSPGEQNNKNYVSVRCQQRGVQQKNLQLILRYGSRQRWFHGATLYYMGKRSLRSALREEPALRHVVDRLVGIAVVVCGSSGRIITTFKTKDGVHRIARNYGAVKRKRDDATGKGVGPGEGGDENSCRSGEQV